jgi:DNA-binding NtrC family response regulator
MDLLSELAERDVPAAILAVSGNEPSRNLLLAIEAGALETATKPFDLTDLIEKMSFCADVGRKKKIYKETASTVLIDQERRHRPVFLSYSQNDRRIAYGIKANIGPWHSGLVCPHDCSTGRRVAS